MTRKEKEKRNNNVAAKDNDNEEYFRVRHKNSKDKLRPTAGHEVL